MNVLVGVCASVPVLRRRKMIGFFGFGWLFVCARMSVSFVGSWFPCVEVIRSVGFFTISNLGEFVSSLY